MPNMAPSTAPRPSLALSPSFARRRRPASQPPRMQSAISPNRESAMGSQRNCILDVYAPDLRGRATPLRLIYFNRQVQGSSANSSAAQSMNTRTLVDRWRLAG